jgi:hypothetical protein
MTKSASFPLDRDPMELSRPSVHAASIVAARYTYRSNEYRKPKCSSENTTHLEVGQPALRGEIHLRMVVQAQRRFTMSSDVRAESVVDHLGDGCRGVEECVC